MKEEVGDLFSCSQCDSSFVTKRSLDSHMKAFHSPQSKVMLKPTHSSFSFPHPDPARLINYDGGTPVPLKVTKHPCQLCNKQFVLEEELTLHLNVVHAEVTLTLANSSQSSIRKSRVSLLKKRPLEAAGLESTGDDIKKSKIKTELDAAVTVKVEPCLIPNLITPTVLDPNFEITNIVRTLLISHMTAESEREAAAAAAQKSIKKTSITQLPALTPKSESDDDDDEFEGESLDTVSSLEENEHVAFVPLVEMNANNVCDEFPCNECGATFVAGYQLERHMEHHNASSRPHKCPICGDSRGFVRREHLNKHMSSVHSGMKFTCEFCGKDISRRDHLVRHIRSVHRCPIPPGLDLLAAAASTLQATKTPPPGSKSDLDDISDKTLQSMQPKPKKPYTKCDMCPMTFTQLEILFQHQRDAHSDIRKYNCGFCSKSFKRREHLQKHVVLHTGEKKFTCAHCSKSFPRRDALQDHLRRIHGTLNPTDSEEFICNLCDKVFSQQANLVRHRSQVHNITLGVVIANTNQGSLLRKKKSEYGSNHLLTTVSEGNINSIVKKVKRPPLPGLLPIESLHLFRPITKLGKKG